MEFKTKLASLLFYGGISKEDYMLVRERVGESNHKALTYWSVLVSVFWMYCLLMSTRAADYAVCRPAYTVALTACILSYMGSRFLIPRAPWTLGPLKWLFRLVPLLGGGIGIAVCQGNVRSITMFAVAIVAPSIFIDSTVISLTIHLTALAVYIALGKGTIAPEIYSWGLGNFILFSAFGLLIGNAINRERFERYVFENTAKRLAEMEARHASFDQMTGLKNRRAYEERLRALSEALPRPCCAVMIDINGLKRMNDSCGHSAGDELIVGAAECLRAAFAGADTIYRLGGDEFCVLLTESEDSVKDCLATLEQLAAERRGRYVNGVSLAYGMASDRDSSDIVEIVKEADTRMYEMKRAYYKSKGTRSRRYTY